VGGGHLPLGQKLRLSTDTWCNMDDREMIVALLIPGVIWMTEGEMIVSLLIPGVIWMIER
jgi:hypothetical protein